MTASSAATVAGKVGNLKSDVTQALSGVARIKPSGQGGGGGGAPQEPSAKTI